MPRPLCGGDEWPKLNMRGGGRILIQQRTLVPAPRDAAFRSPLGAGFFIKFARNLTIIDTCSVVQYYGGMYIKVFVTPDAKRESVEERGETLVISVREPALQNRANDRVRGILAERFGKAIGKVRILTGHHSRGKMVSINS